MLNRHVCDSLLKKCSIETRPLPPVDMHPWDDKGRHQAHVKGHKERKDEDYMKDWVCQSGDGEQGKNMKYRRGEKQVLRKRRKRTE